MKNFEPLNKRVLVRPDPVAKTVGAILLPESIANEKPTTGAVVALATSSDLVVVGDTVYFSKFAGIPITIAGDDYIILKDDEILARGK